MIRLLTLLLFSLPAFGQAWSGILASDRASDWTLAGVSGDIPARATICQTISAGASASTINTAITNCASGQTVYLSAGTYSLGANALHMKSGVTLRGAGADQTKLVFTDSASCSATFGNICFGASSSWIQGGYSSTPQQSADWTAGYSQGTSTITLSNTTNLSVGDIIILDQLNDSSDSAGMYVCKTGGVCSYTDGGGDVWGDNRHQRKVTTVTNISGSSVTLATPLNLTNWRTGQTPKARWRGSAPLSYAGLEDLSIDATAYAYESTSVISMLGAVDSWIKGVRVIGGNRSFVQVYQCTRIEIRDSYFVMGKSGVSESYGLETFSASSDVLIENNILQHITAPVVVNDGGENIVIGYNFTIDNFRADVTNLMSASYHLHSPGVSTVLLEGNSGTAFVQDNWYGTVHFVTLFRNHLYGDICSTYLSGCPSKTAQTSIVQAAAYSRFFNFVGNVMGRSGYYADYEIDLDCASDNIYCLGYSHASGGVTDDETYPRAMRWGNYDTVTDTVRWENSEVPSGLSQFDNPVPANHTLPSSFYIAAKPEWFGTNTWPAVGPDVTSGTISGYDGYANPNPARVCWESLAEDSAYGSSYATGQIQVFNANTCYYSATIIRPEPPTDVVVTFNDRLH
jgi:hypothetical protein